MDATLVTQEVALLLSYRTPVTRKIASILAYILKRSQRDLYCRCIQTR